MTIANLEPHKNQAAVIRALAALSGRHPRLRYELIGRDRDRQESRTSRAPSASAIALFSAGRCPTRRRSGSLRRHVHVMPSIHDAFGVAHIEAMAAGLPAIGGAGTGAEDIAGAGGDGVGAGVDVTAIARAIEQLVGDEGGRERLGEAARRTVAERFSWSERGGDGRPLWGGCRGEGAMRGGGLLPGSLAEAQDANQAITGEPLAG